MAAPTELSTFNSQPFNGLIFNDPLVEVVVPPVAPPTTVLLRGVPALAGRRFRRLRPVPLEGVFLFSLLTRGRLSVGRALKGRVRSPPRVVGRLSRVQKIGGLSDTRPRIGAALARGGSFIAVALLSPPTVTGQVKVTVGLRGDELADAADVIAELRTGAAMAGTTTLLVTAPGAAVAGRSLVGAATYAPAVVGDVEADDEQTVLALLDLPSEVLL